ncbi:MAG: glyoxalase [Flavicella sp.]
MDDLKLKIRPQIKRIGSLEGKKEVERFQNKTLRPILKLQHTLIMTYFENYLLRRKVKYKEKTSDKKHAFIETLFAKDQQFKIELKAFILGLLTVEEFKQYTEISSDANKRILTMLKQRIQSTIEA